MNVVYSHPFSAVIIGGPPHSGKTVLVYTLTQALRQRQVGHYVLRACPDGEGDWANESKEQLVQILRGKGQYTPEFVQRVTHDIQNRHAPLLVDVGGEPRHWQESILAAGTAAILLVANHPENPTFYEQKHTWWQDLFKRHGVPVVADLISQLEGEDFLETTSPIFKGQLTGLERHQTLKGAVIEGLVNYVADLLGYSEQQLVEIHQNQAPFLQMVDLPTLARRIRQVDDRWQPEMLPALSDYLSLNLPLAVYGRGPVWLYAYLGLLFSSTELAIFDMRLGWIAPPQLTTTLTPLCTAFWNPSVENRAEGLLVRVETNAAYLDIQEPEQMPLPDVPANAGIILSGPLPNWYWIAASRLYAPQSKWLAIYQPSLNAAVIIHSQDRQNSVGKTIPLPSITL